MHLLQLIRWQNLLIVCATQWLIWFCVIHPVAGLSGQTLLLQWPEMAMLSVSTVLIAAAGYIINDYFDIRIDAINRPDKMVLEHQIPRRSAIILHNLMNALALWLAYQVARRGGDLRWLACQGLSTLLLWFYSTHFKQRFAIGNVVVSVLTALTVLILLVYEPALYAYVRRPAFIHDYAGDWLANPVYVLVVYAGFAFLLTWMREIVKDMEDLKGDEAEGCRTMPIVWGLRRSALFARGLGVAALVPLLVAGVRLAQQGEWWLGGYVLLLLAAPLTAWMAHLTRAATTAHYATSSRWLKAIMVLGVGSLLIYFFEANG